MNVIQAFAATAALTLSLTSSAWGSVIVDASPAGPYQDNFVNQSTSQNFLVAFTLAEKTQIDSVDIFTEGYWAAVGAPTTVRFRNNADGQPAETNLYEIAASVTSISDAIDQYDNVAVSVDLPPIILDAGTYWFGVSGTTSELGWSGFRTGTESWSVLEDETIRHTFGPGEAGYDLPFRISGEVVHGDVPEPGSLVLTAVAMLGLATARRRKG